MEIKLPATKDDLRLRHLDALAYMHTQGDLMTVHQKVRFVSMALGISQVRVATFDLTQLGEIVSHFVSLLAQMDVSKEAPKHIELAGTKLQLVDIVKAPGGFYMDAATLIYQNKGLEEFHKMTVKEKLLAASKVKPVEVQDIDPVKLAAICYIPEGSTYGDLDQHDNMLYPLASRTDLMRDELPLETYLQLSGFFLRKWSTCKASFIRRLKKEMLKKRLRLLLPSSGSNSSTSSAVSTATPGAK